MSALQRILAVILVATAIVIAVNWVITPIYHNGSAEYPVWKVLNWFMGFAILVSPDCEFHPETRAPKWRT